MKRITFFIFIACLFMFLSYGHNKEEQVTNEMNTINQLELDYNKIESNKIKLNRKNIVSNSLIQPIPEIVQYYHFVIANGVAIIITGDESSTTIYIDNNQNGVVDEGEQSLHEAGILDAPLNNADLSDWYIFGGTMNTEYIGDTHITMNSGKVKEITGCCYSANMTGNSYITVNGGSITELVRGGGGEGSNVNGNSNITINGGVMCNVNGGGFYGNVINASITVNGGTIKGNVDLSNKITGDIKTLTITGGSIGGSISGVTPKNNSLTPVDVYKTTLTFKNYNAVKRNLNINQLTISEDYIYGINDVITDNNGKIYIYLPAEKTIIDGTIGYDIYKNPTTNKVLTDGSTIFELLIYGPNSDGTIIYTNGIPIRVVAGTVENYTNVLYDKNNDGIIFDDEYLNIGDNQATSTGYDLSGYMIAGEANNTDVVINIEGGYIGDVFGGHASSASEELTKNIIINMSGGSVQRLIATGLWYGQIVGGTGKSISITITGGTVRGGDNDDIDLSTRVISGTTKTLIITGGNICGSISGVVPTDGSTNVYKTTLTFKDGDVVKVNSKVDSLSLDDNYSYGMKDVTTDTSGSLYVYLPEGKTITTGTINSEVYTCNIMVSSSGSIGGQLSTHYHPVCGENCSHAENHIAVTWHAVTIKNNKLCVDGVELETFKLTDSNKGQYYYLLADIQLPDGTYLNCAEANLCLNGHNIIGADGQKCVNAYNTSICDCENTGCITHNNGTSGVGIQSINYPFTLYGGKICGNEIGIYSSGASDNSLYIYGGEVSANYQGGLKLYKSTLYLYDGAIINNGSTNFTDSFGGISSNTEMYISGGVITGNIALSDGSGVRSGNIKLSGNPIIDNNYICSVTEPSHVHETDCSTEMNLYLTTTQTIQIISALLDGANIGISAQSISTAEAPITITNNSSYTITDNDLSYLHNDDSTESLALTEGVVLLTHVHNWSEIPAVESTCLIQGNDQYFYCSNCNKYYEVDKKTETSIEAQKLPFGDHIYGTLIPEVPASHDVTGMHEYYKCSVCNKFFDASKNEVSENSLVIDIISHSYSSEWKNDMSNHWHECTCGDKKDLEQHTYDNDCDTTCNTCDYIREITHNYTNEWSSDISNHWHECTCGEKKDLGQHMYDNDCDTTCNTCGYVRVITHNYSPKWQSDTSNHWHECSCGDKSDLTQHTYTNDGDATCDICGYSRVIILPKITEGANSEWEQNSETDIIICSDADYNSFSNVEVDGKIINSSNYTITNDKITITLKSSYLETLETGEHIVSLVSITGKASTKLTILPKKGLSSGVIIGLVMGGIVIIGIASFILAKSVIKKKQKNKF